MDIFKSIPSKLLWPLSILSLIGMPFLMSSCDLTGKGDSEKEETVQETTLYRILAGEKYGFMDNTGKIILNPQYDEAHRYFSDGVSYVRIDNKKYIIDKTGAVTGEIGDSIKNVYKFIGGYARIVGNNGGEGIISSNGQIIIDPVYHKTAVNKDGRNIYLLVEEVDNNGTVSFMTDTLGTVIGQKYDTILNGFKQGLAPVKSNGKWGYMDTEGNLVIEPVYDSANQFSEDGLALVSKDGKQSFLDKTGKSVIEVDKALTDFSNNRAAVIIEGEKFLIDSKGEKIAQLDCENIFAFGKDSLVTVIRNGKASKIDADGNVVLETKLDNIGEFHNGVAYASRKNLWGAIDTLNKVVVNFTHERFQDNEVTGILSFTDKVNGRNIFSYYDTEGNLLWKDIPAEKVLRPQDKPKRTDFVEYYDANITDLDPIEGIYYVTQKAYRQNKINPDDTTLIFTKSDIMAIARRNSNKDEYTVSLVDGTGFNWANKFVKKEGNNYAIVNNSKNQNHRYSSDGQVSIDNPSLFEFRLEQESTNPYHNQFVTYEFLRDYPSYEEYQNHQHSKWSGTGFAIADGIIATTYDLTRGAKDIQIKGVNGDVGTSYKAFVLASDKENDLALLKIVDKDFEGFKPIPYEITSDSIKGGTEISILGYPITTTPDSKIDTLKGQANQYTGYNGDQSTYQLSAELKPGINGAPVFNSDGNIIAIVRETSADSEPGNYAVKSGYLLDLIKNANYPIKVTGKKATESEDTEESDVQPQNFVYLIECRIP